MKESTPCGLEFEAIVKLLFCSSEPKIEQQKHDEHSRNELKYLLFLSNAFVLSKDATCFRHDYAQW